MRIILWRQGSTLYLPCSWMLSNSRYQEKNLKKGERTPWNFLKSEERLNSDFSNVEATVMIFFCITAMSHPELSASASACANTETQMCPAHHMQYCLIFTSVTQHLTASCLPFWTWRTKWATHFPFTLHLTFSSQLRYFTFTKSRIEGNKNQKFSFMRPPQELDRAHSNTKIRVQEWEPLLSIR